MKALFQLFCAISFIQNIKCSAIISIELLNYTNPRGTNVFGNKCDVFPGGSELPCDPSFHLCVSPRPNNSGSCLWTYIWMNKNIVKFNRGMEIAPGKTNPLLYEFGDQLEDEITLNVVARDEDGIFDDQMDMLKARINLNERAKSKEVTLKGEISNLSLRIRTLCLSKDPGCNTRCTPVLSQESTWVCKEVTTCVPRDDEKGHYECDDVTGKKKCLPGWADEINDCIDDVKSEVSCSINYMRIDIDRRYFNPAKYSAITLLDSSCKATISKFHITLDSMPQHCGSKRTQIDGYIVYENEVYMKAIPTDALITREHDVRISFKCSYNRSDITSSKTFRPLTSIDVQEDAALLYRRPGERKFSYGKKGFSIFTFNIKMFADQTYKKLQTKFPVAIKLNESIYIEVNSTSTDEDLVLLIDRCYATPTFDFNHPLKYTFIEKGTSSTEAKCVDGCNGGVLSRTRRDTQGQLLNTGRSYTKYYLVNIGPMERNFKGIHKYSNGDKNDVTKQRASSPVVRVVLLIGVSMFGLIAIGMFIIIVRRDHENHQVKENIERVVENTHLHSREQSEI